MPHLSLTFLGAFQAELGDERLTAFRSAKAQALLVILALRQQQPQSRDVLAALLWPDESDSVARKNLRQSLYQLRQVLDEAASEEVPYLRATRSTVQFNPEGDHALDVKQFLAHLEGGEQERAVALYRGDLLPGFTCNSLPFEEWLREERQRLHRLALDALFELARDSLAQADYETAQEMARRQLSLEPWREEAHRQLMQALALQGERSAALAQYEICQEMLDQELGVQASAETEALVARIRSQQMKGGWDHQPRQSPATSARRVTLPFVGRKDEHGQIVRAYRKALTEGARVVTVVGEAGIGKTRLAHSFLAWAATQGADILRGRAFETSGRLSYQPITQLLRRRLDRENAPEDLLSDMWLTQLTRILPELGERYPDLPAPTQGEGTARQHLFEAIARLGLALAERSPLVMFIDDWHWADAASLDVLHYVTLRWLEKQAPILLLLTLRHEALADNPDLQTWMTRFRHDVASVQLELAALSAAETEQLIRTLLQVQDGEEGTPPAGAKNQTQMASLSRWLFEETDGQPFFLVEMLKALAEEGLLQPDPNTTAWQVDWNKFEEQAAGAGATLLPGVREIIGGWLDRISAPGGALLTAAAVLGPEATFSRLYQVADLGESHALEALDELLARQLLLEEFESVSAPGRDPAYTFSHQKLGEVVYTEAGAARRRILHRRAFDALQGTGGKAVPLAHHALNAGLWAEAIRYSIAAGNEAMRLLAVRVAVTHYETAWQLVGQRGWPEAVSGADRQDLYAGLGRAYEVAEAWQQAQETYEAMVAHARTIEATAMECFGLNRLATVYINGFQDTQQAVALLEEARTVAEQSGNRRALAETEWNLSLAARVEQDTYLSRHHGEQALAIARDLGHPQLLARCLNSMAYVHARLRQWETVQSYANEACDLYAAAGNRILEADSRRVAGWSLSYSGRARESLVTLRETFDFSREIENAWGQAESGWRLALAQLEMGRYGRARKMAELALSQARTVGQPTMVVMALSTWGAVQRTVMALEPARETLVEALERTSDKGWTGFADWPLAELCALHALAGDWDQAHLYAERIFQARRDESLLPMGLTGWYETEALLRGGDEDLARAEVGRLGQIVGNNKRYHIPFRRSRAVLAAWDGELEQAVSHLQAASALAGELGLPGEEWSILAALGSLYAKQEREAEAQRAWNEAGELVRRLAGTIEEEDLRAGFLEAETVRPILERTEAG